MRSFFRRLRRPSPLSVLPVAALAPLASLLCLAACGNEIVRAGAPGTGGTGGAGAGAGPSSSSEGQGASGGGRAASSTGTWQSTTAATSGAGSYTTTAATSGPGGSPTPPPATRGGGGYPTTPAATRGAGGGTLCAGPGGTLPPSACNPTAAQGCGVPPSVCLATVDAHAAPSFGLRVAQLTLSAPTIFTGTGVVSGVFQQAVEERLLACNLSGAGGLNWLLAFDTANGTLTTGAATPTGNPAPQPYAFLSGLLQAGSASFDVGPITLSAPVDTTCGFASSAGDVNLPIYQGGADPIALLPLRSLRLQAAVTPDHNCVGAFAPSALDPANGCVPYPGQQAFTDGGSLDAHISLEEADTVFVTPLSQTLCVLLSGDPAQYGDGQSPAHCKRGAGNAIVFQGDWCSSTDQPAAAGCADAARFAGTFAASGTAIQ